MSRQQQLDDLLADRALWGLPASEEEALQRTMGELGIRDVDASWEATAALVATACANQPFEEPSESLLRKLDRDALCYVVRTHGAAALEPDGGP